MENEALHTAVLVFIRTPREEARAKSLAPRSGGRDNRRIASLLNRRAIRLARRSGFPFYVIDSNRQRGGSFGERFVNALQEVLARHPRVLAIGNDCLGLRIGHLEEAGRLLSRRDLVIGPDTRGGTYLLGLTRAGFRRADWLGLPWQTNRLLAALTAFGREHELPFSYLSRESDVEDAPSLLARLRRLPARSRLRRRLMSFFLPATLPGERLPSTPPMPAVLTYGLRAPPLPGPTLFA